jgi:DNA processing protein
MAAPTPPRTLHCDDADFPKSLLELEQPPSQLFCSGELPDFSQAVAIVGTRRADRFALAFARSLARELAEAGCALISGGALGIDSAAHRGALDAGGATVAVLPTGLSQPYPAANHALFREISESGALLSEFEAEVPGFKSTFLDRNRLVAALAKVVIVVQAPLPSGALSTAAHAKRLGRPLLVVPHAPWDLRGAGCLTLLAGGAGVCRNSADVLSLAARGGEKCPGRQPKTRRKRELFRGLDEDERRVVEALSGEALQADELCERAQLPAPRVQRALLMLLLSKVIQEVGCGHYARTDCL